MQMQIKLIRRFFTKTVVLAHGGTIRGENKKDGGACFTVTLPMKGDDDED